MSNALATEKSPYLLQHADNPVDWMPWGEAAFARARAEQKPIFLSIGYSTCHWCHVMAHESFENEAIAAQLNEHFISIKVDREERPDVDKIYMTYVQAATGHGGWPLSAFLTPELKPFFGGTYFPPEDRHGRHGFPTLLRAIADGWKNEREKLVAESHRVIESLRNYQAQQAGAEKSANGSWVETVAETFEKGYQYFYESFDAQKGGFGGAPKFPRASNLNFLFRAAVVQGVDSETGREALQMVEATLQAMARGGIHDHVGGGFHRYSVDDGWFVPHFEKMLYDQAQIAVNYLDVFLATRRETYAWVARGIFDYVLRDLAHPAGAFYSAEDADSLPAAPRPDAGGHGGKIEGAFYVWTQAELEAALGADAAFFCAHFGVKPAGNVPRELDPQGEFTGANILKQSQSLADSAQAWGWEPGVAGEKLVALLEKLRAFRASRPRPHLDDKIITAWNGLMISALARGAVTPADCLADQKAGLLAAAVKAAEFVRRELYDDVRGVLYRNYRDGRGVNEGFAEDYACLISGLLDLYDATLEARWLAWADRLQTTMDERFWDVEAAGYFNSQADDASIVLRLKEDYDGAEPSPNSIAAGNLLRFSALFHDEALQARAMTALEAFRAQWQRAPQALPEMLCAMERTIETPRQIVLAGDPKAPAWASMVSVVHARGGQHRALLAVPAGTTPDDKWLLDRAPWLAAMMARPGMVMAYVCEDYSCQSPVDCPAALSALLNARFSLLPPGDPAVVQNEYPLPHHHA